MCVCVLVIRVLEREAKRNQRKGGPIVLYDWVAEKRAIEMEQPVPSPKIYEYRNKCEFTFGYRLVEEGKKEGDEAKKVEVVAPEEVKDEDMKKDEDATEEAAKVTNFRKIPFAGFLAQGWQGGVYPPHCLQNMPDWSCGLADIFNNEFLPSSSVPPYDSKVHRGIWRTVTLRVSLRTKECMVIVQHAPAKGGAGAKDDGSDDYSKEFEGEKARLIGLLTDRVIPTPIRDFPEGHGSDEMIDASSKDAAAVAPKKEDAAEAEEDNEGIRVTSIFFQEYEGLSHPTPDHPVQVSCYQIFLYM